MQAARPSSSGATASSIEVSKAGASPGCKPVGTVRPRPGGPQLLPSRCIRKNPGVWLKRGVKNEMPPCAGVIGPYGVYPSV